MKTRLFPIAFFVATLILFSNANAAGEYGNFEDYTITQLENGISNSDIDAAWYLSYESDESPIVISFKANKHCKTYLVRGDHFEVVYECSKKGFGVREVKSSESIFPTVLNEAVLNETEMAKQKVITQGPISHEEALALIASYLPDLVNPSYQHLLN